jgi:alpha-1,6-mannosyltransferase
VISVAARPLCIADVTLFYGERSGGIRTYLEAKAAYARRTGDFEHHVIVPGERHSLRLVASNGYRLPLGSTGLCATLRDLAPDVVLLHDPYWTPRLATRVAHEVGSTVIAVHHASSALQAAGLPGPDGLYAGALQRWYRRAYRDVDAIMSVVDPVEDAGRTSALSLRLGLDPAFGPDLGIERGDHVLYVGRFSREKGLRELLEAAGAATEAWPLVLLGAGPAIDTLRERGRQLGLGRRITFAPYVADRDALAREYAAARCVVMPGPYETFGLVALEAAACGVPVVTADCAPAAAHVAALGETFRAGDPQQLLSAIERARRRPRDPEAAERIVARHGWDAAFEAELTDVTRLINRR